MKGNRYFCDSDGHVWSIKPDGSSNHPAEVEISEGLVLVMGLKDEGEMGQRIMSKHKCWPTLTELAKEIEPELDTVE